MNNNRPPRTRLSPVPAAIGQQAVDLSYLRGATAADAARVQINRELAVKAFILEAQVTTVAETTLMLRQHLDESFPDKTHPIHEAVTMVLDTICNAMIKAEADVVAGMSGQQPETPNAPNAG